MSWNGANLTWFDDKTRIIPTGDYRLGDKVITIDGLIGTWLGCFENDDHLAIRDEHGTVHSYHRNQCRLWSRE